MKFETHD